MQNRLPPPTSRDNHHISGLTSTWRQAIVFLVVLFLAHGSFAVAAGPDMSRYELAFSDEFNGTELDPTKWNTGLLWGPYLPINNEEQMYIDTLGMHEGFEYSPFQFTGNSLKIIATPVTAQLQPPARPAEDDPIWDNYAEYRFNGPTEDGPGYQASDIQYLSGVLTSYDSYRFTHGYVETRMRLPAGQGLWPAFWANTSFYVEDVPEIDVMEFLGQDTDRVYHTYHYFETQNNWRLISTPSYTTLGPDFTRQWHTFGMEWGPETIIWYVDGLETRRIDSSEYDIANQAMYLLLNLAVGGNWPGSPDDTTPFPAELEIDYVRAYRQKPIDLITDEVLASDYQLMFEDEFEGPTISTDKWKSNYLWGPYFPINNELQIYPDMLGEHQDYPVNPFAINDGVLSITATAVADEELPEKQAPDSDQFVRNPTWQSVSGYRDPESENYYVPDYVSGLLTSYDAFKFVHGYAEIRAKVPNGGGLWPAFWLLNGYYVDQQPEIDVMEFRGDHPDEVVHSYHHFTSEGLQSESSITSGPDYTAGFHTYGVHWQPGRIDWYVDGQIEYTTQGDKVSSQLMYVILNLAVGGNFVGPVDETALPASYEIDYVRVWQRKLPDQIEPDCDVKAGLWALPDNQWRMVGLPCVPPQDGATVQDVFGDDINGEYGTDWILFTYDPSIEPPASPYVDPGIDGQLRVGQGFWIIQVTGNTVLLDMPEGSTYAGSERPCDEGAACADTPLSNPAPEGLTWDMTGNPIAPGRTVAFDELNLFASSGTCSQGCSIPEARTRELIREGFFYYNGVAYEPLVTDGANLDAWKSYWVAGMPGARGLSPVLQWTGR